MLTLSIVWFAYGVAFVATLRTMCALLVLLCLELHSCTYIYKHSPGTPSKTVLTANTHATHASSVTLTPFLGPVLGSVDLHAPNAHLFNTAPCFHSL